MRRLRERRQRGFTVYHVEVSEADIDAFVARGFLDRMKRHDKQAIQAAIHALLDRL